MRPIQFLLLGFLLHAPTAFAVKDLMSLCERNLTVDKENELKLAPNQIALKGRLSTYWVPGLGQQIGWVMVDEWLRKNISPAGQDYVYWIMPGDRVYVLGSEGQVLVSGYFGEPFQQDTLPVNGQMTEMYTNVPYLYRDPQLTQPLTTQAEMRQHFHAQARTVVVKTLGDTELQTLKTRLEPYFRRYEINRTREDRIVLVGRRRAFELAHFQTPLFGTASVTHTKERFQLLDGYSGDLEPGPEFHVFKYAIQSSGGAVSLKQGDYIMLLDENGVVTSEGTIGSEEFPWYSDDDKVPPAVKARFAGAHSAFVASLAFRKLD